MIDFQVIMIVGLFLMIGCLSLSIALGIARYCMHRRVSIETLFIGLRPKLWMTAGLGLFFVVLYGGIVLAMSYGFDAEMRQALFKMAYLHPQYFIYAGLSFFVFFSLTVLVVRSFIKRLYNSYLSKK